MGDGWLETQRLRRSQYRSPRRGRFIGVVELHDAESIMDTLGPDTGAENVARFIVDRDTPGSYHDICDSDSAVHLVDYDDEAFHDATGFNPTTTSLSWACRTIDWARMTPAKRRQFLAQGAAKAADQARHQHAATGLIVRPVRIGRAQALSGRTGFLYHGDSDPSRRTDPGTTKAAPFPWDEFAALYEIAAADLLGGTPTPPPTEEPLMVTESDKKAIRDLLRSELGAHGMAVVAASDAADDDEHTDVATLARRGYAYGKAVAQHLDGELPAGMKVRERAAQIDAEILAKAKG